MRAEERERAGRRLLYAAQMNLAQQAWEASDLDRARALVEAQQPAPGQEDLRGFEWRYLWRLSRYTSLRRSFLTQGLENSAFALSADGRLLAVWGGDRAIRVFHLPDGRHMASLHDLKGLRGPIGGSDQNGPMAFSPDGRLFVASAGDHTLRLWRMAARGPLVRFAGEQDRISNLAFSPDSRLLATANEDGTIRLWDTAAPRPIARLRGPTKAVWSLAFSPHGKLLASGGVDGTIRLWELTSRREVGVLRGHQGTVWLVTFCREGQLLASVRWPETVVRLWDVTTGKEVGSLQGHTAPIHSLAVSPHGRLLATGSADTTIRLWDLPGTGPHRPTLRVGAPPSAPPAKREVALLQGHNQNVIDVVFAPDGRQLASASGDGTVRLWNIATRQPVATLRGHRGGVSQVAFLPDGKSLVSSSQDRTVRLWDAVVPSPADLLRGPRDGAEPVAFSNERSRFLLS